MIEPRPVINRLDVSGSLRRVRARVSYEWTRKKRGLIECNCCATESCLKCSPLAHSWACFDQGCVRSSELARTTPLELLERERNPLGCDESEELTKNNANASHSRRRRRRRRSHLFDDGFTGRRKLFILRINASKAAARELCARLQDKNVVARTR